MTARILIEPIPKEGPNGDRDTQRHPYLDYRVHMLIMESDKPTDDTVIYEVSGYDSWHSHIKNKADVRRDAEEHATRVAELMGAKVVMPEADIKIFQITMAPFSCIADSEAEAWKLFTAQRDKLTLHISQRRTK